MKDYTVLYSLIPHGLQRYYLIRGSIYSSLGISLLLFFGGFSSVEILEQFGLSIWLLSLTVIAFGWRPYIKIKKVMTRPPKLYLYEESLSIFNSAYKSSPIQIPYKNIQDVSFEKATAETCLLVLHIKYTFEKIPIPYFNNKHKAILTRYICD